MGAMVFFTLETIANAQILVHGAGVQVNTAEVREDLSRATAAARKSLETREAMQNNVSNIYARRVLAKEALAVGMDKNPLVLAAIERARERILSDAMLERLDQAHQPNLQDLEAYAQSLYKSNPKRFEQAEQIKAAHILIRTAEPQGQQKAEEIRKELQMGADFGKLAKERSQDPGSAGKDGDLGFFTRGRMVKPFEEAAFALKNPGDISPVIETPFGWHIIRLTERKPAGIKPFEEVKENLMREAQNEILNKARLAEKDRIMSGATFNLEAIEELAKSMAEMR